MIVAITIRLTTQSVGHIRESVLLVEALSAHHLRFLLPSMWDAVGRRTLLAYGPQIQADIGPGRATSMVQQNKTQEYNTKMHNDLELCLTLPDA